MSSTVGVRQSAVKGILEQPFLSPTIEGFGKRHLRTPARSLADLNRLLPSRRKNVNTNSAMPFSPVKLTSYSKSMTADFTACLP